jgi:hypothetical protein
LWVSWSWRCYMCSSKFLIICCRNEWRWRSWIRHYNERREISLFLKFIIMGSSSCSHSSQKASSMHWNKWTSWR